LIVSGGGVIFNDGIVCVFYLISRVGLLVLYDLLALTTIPNIMAVDIKELPPDDIKGKVIPVIGIIPMFIPMFINT